MVDLTAVMSAFQGMNNCRLTVEISVEDVHNLSEMSLKLLAWTVVDPDGDPLPSVFQSVTRKVSTAQSLEAAVLQLLYALDFQLAEDEFAGNKNG